MPKLHRVGAIIQNGKDIVLIHRFKGSQEYYAIPGGNIDHGETPDIAILREVDEELGLHLDKCKFVLEVNDNDRQDFYFSCTTTDTDFVVTGDEKNYLNDPEKLFEPQWINKKNINNNIQIYPENGRELIYKTLK